ncbi:suppressor of fused domain protein [Haloferula sp.]|uniref:suppressor of fused domain protein n=1 Tax=Haloferula sp. TaxID=2497595 RepID=UPI003C7080A6
MKDESFYAELFRSIHERIGPIDDTDIVPFVGFDRSGMIRLSSVGRDRSGFVTYITCELATRDEQRLAGLGNYEFMISCDDQSWAREVLTQIGRMSFNTAFEDGHAIDLCEAFGSDFPMAGLLVEEFAKTSVGDRPCGIFRIHGVTRTELDYSIRFGTNKLLEAFKTAGLYPHTTVRQRRSLVEMPQTLLRMPAGAVPPSRRARAVSSS